MPGYGALNDLVNRIDPVELARALNAWLTENSDLLPKSLALDGKDLGAKSRLVCCLPTPALWARCLLEKLICQVLPPVAASAYRNDGAVFRVEFPKLHLG